ncbi:LPXTG cell wall anchor domain-containing protein [Tenacibaculum sp. TC6]|uniref:LPXTG cell wall anchor domain-containing protein n=1 Tax=Tenacibaculum sp. TC6 TaxID=3423223 RepID=UPI003D363BF1
MIHQFDSPPSLAGWFDGFCPSNGIADDLERKARDINAQKAEWDKKYKALETGARAAEWAELKKDIIELEDKVEKLTLELQKEQGIIDALGIGLGAWCNGAVTRRRNAENALRQAEQALGQIKGAYLTLEKQQNEGIKIGGENIVKLKETIKELENKILAAQQKIAAYKANRDNKTVSEDQADKNSAIKGQLKENAPLIIGGIALLGLAFYVVKNKKKTTATRVVA